MDIRIMTSGEMAKVGIRQIYRFTYPDTRKLGGDYWKYQALVLLLKPSLLGYF